MFILLLSLFAGATAIDFCGYVSRFLPSECNCANVNHGFDLQCNVNFFNLDKLGVELNVEPCGQPAEAVLDFTDTKFDIHHQLAGLVAGKTLKWPVPGLSLDFPEVGEIGVVLDFGFIGNAASLTINIDIDACGKIEHVGICGSELHLGLPLNVFSHTFDFSEFCTNSSMHQEPLGKLLELPKPMNKTRLPTRTKQIEQIDIIEQVNKRADACRENGQECEIDCTYCSGDCSKCCSRCCDGQHHVFQHNVAQCGVDVVKNIDTSSCHYASYKQCDSKWGDLQLGTSTNTICHAGCAMTSVAMFLQTSGNNLTPLQLNEYLISNGGYASKDLLIWSAVDSQFGVTFQGKNKSPTVDGIKQGLNNCHGLIANVRSGSHWVLITEYVSGTTFNVHDPGFNTATYDLSDMSQFQIGDLLRKLKYFNKYILL